MRILLHVCCGPCSIYPIRILRESDQELTGFFYNPNIHPYLEYKKRMETLNAYAESQAVPMIYSPSYDLERFFQEIVDHEPDRCLFCYEMRLSQAAITAVTLGCDAFTTTLLYSRYQKHELVRSVGERLARKYLIHFHYVDFRQGWSEGIKTSKALRMYRQAYCGCVYSERDRYARVLYHPQNNIVIGMPASHTKYIC